MVSQQRRGKVFKKALHKVAGFLSDTFWLIPGVTVVAGILGATALIELDRNGLLSASMLQGAWLYNGGGIGARTLPGTVASSTVGVAGTVFSITIAALSLAAGRMGPRLLRNFKQDWRNQGTLGAFLGTFSYALMVLRSVRTRDEGTFAPHLSLSVSILMAFGGVGMLVYFIGHMACLLFGAKISPTDPIAVLGILQSAKAPKEIELVIAGESLFNDGVGVVIFSLLLGVLASGTVPTAGESLQWLLREAGGGVVFGLVLGYGTFRLLKSIDPYQVEVLLTLAAVIGGYALASHLHVSGPLAMVVAGLMIGNGGRAETMSDTAERYVDMFWKLLNEILNAVLFVLLGLAVLVIDLSGTLLFGGLAVIVVTLMARRLTVGWPVAFAWRPFGLPRGSFTVLTWGGLRGGISVTLALSLPAGPARDTVVTLTYCVVVFSTLVQGLTIGRVVRQVACDLKPAKPTPRTR